MMTMGASVMPIQLKIDEAYGLAALGVEYPAHGQLAKDILDGVRGLFFDSQ